MFQLQIGIIICGIIQVGQFAIRQFTYLARRRTHIKIAAFQGFSRRDQAAAPIIVLDSTTTLSRRIEDIPIKQRSLMVQPCSMTL